MFKELNKQNKYSLAWFRLKLLKDTLWAMTELEKVAHFTPAP